VPLAALLIPTALAGCSGTPIESRLVGPPDELTELSVDGAASPLHRARAIRGLDAAADAGEAPMPSTREHFKDIVWRATEPLSVRIAAYEALLNDDGYGADTQRMTELMLPTEVIRARGTGFVEVIASTAVERGWTGLTPALVRSLSLPFGNDPPEARPEFAAIAALNTESDAEAPGRVVADAVWSVFAGERRASDGKPLEAEDQRAAWALLMQLDAGRELALERARAGGGPGDAQGPLLALIRRGARELSIVPNTASELAWLERLAELDHQPFWRRAASVVDGLEGEQLNGLELRHLAGLVYAARFRPELLAMTPGELESEVARMLGGRDHRWRARRTAGEIPNESIEGNRSRLVFGDMVLIASVVEMFDRAGDGALVALGELGDRDMLDSTTEHGGILDAGEEGELVVYHYPPRLRDRGDDERMVASEAMIDAGTDALFHFHLHARDYDSGPLAGPSLGDIGYAINHGRSCLVLTFLDTDTMNADYYQPNGAVIDLGSFYVRGRAERARTGR
jgi:hypothetical protein